MPGLTVGALVEADRLTIWKQAGLGAVIFRLQVSPFKEGCRRHGVRS